MNAKLRTPKKSSGETRALLAQAHMALFRMGAKLRHRKSAAEDKDADDRYNAIRTSQREVAEPVGYCGSITDVWTSV